MPDATLERAVKSRRMALTTRSGFHLCGVLQALGRGDAGGDLASLEARFRASINGNNMCHCIHVTELQEAVKKIEA